MPWRPQFITAAVAALGYALSRFKPNLTINLNWHSTPMHRLRRRRRRRRRGKLG